MADVVCSSTTAAAAATDQRERNNGNEKWLLDAVHLWLVLVFCVRYSLMRCSGSNERTSRRIGKVIGDSEKTKIDTVFGLATEAMAMVMITVCYDAVDEERK